MEINSEKLDKIFVERLTEFNQSYKERIEKVESVVEFFVKIKKDEKIKNLREIEVLDKKLDEYFGLLCTEIKILECSLK